MAPYAATIALSAVLLFLVQPIIAKQILPWFGGSAGVWSVCMVFFQSTLLAGYAYAHFSSRRLPARLQFRVHVLLLGASLLLLPIIPSVSFKPVGGQDAATSILLVLLVTIGLPYFLLSSTGPLLQAWIAHRFPARSVYRMFALSNLGSLLGLVAFPFVIEPVLGANAQAWCWSLLYLLFVAGCAWAAYQNRNAEPSAQANASTADAGPPAVAPTGAVPAGSAGIWLGLSGLGVILLLGATNQLLQNVASVPFLWVVPLALYLLSFALVFEGRAGRGWYDPRWGVPAALLVAILMAAGLSANNGVLDVNLAVPLYCAGLFLACLFCHGELAARKPPSADLTRFYLMISIGGAMGGIFVGLIAPRIFASLYELPLALFFVAVAAFFAVWQRPGLGPRWSAALALASLGAAGAVGWADWHYARFLDRDLIVMERNFYGTLRVREIDDGPVRLRRLLHGVILHGEQQTSGPEQNQPGSYYSHTSGVGLAIARAQQEKAAVRLGVIGLGVGTLASYGRMHDSVRFYELDRDVVQLANSRFTYLRSSPARVEVALGDARISLERELALGQPQQFDVLAVDAFSSDSIPVHLLTREAILFYRRHMAPGGLIALHISNRFLDLQPVLANIAADLALGSCLVDDAIADSASNASSSEWVLIAADPQSLRAGAIGERCTPLHEKPGVGVWTDGYNNLRDVMKTSPAQAIARLIESWREQ